MRALTGLQENTVDQDAKKVFLARDQPEFATAFRSLAILHPGVILRRPCQPGGAVNRP
jgi:hypothetical protein